MSVNIFDPKPRPQGDPALFYAACNEYSEITELLLQSDKVDKHEMYFGHNVYRHYDVCVIDKYKEYSDLDQNGHYRTKNINANKMFILLEKFGLATEKPIVYASGGPSPSTIKALEPAIKFDEPKEN